MDQAISILAEPGTAKRIEFNPLRTFDVFLPNGSSFVVAHCGKEMNKAATSDFNQRVVECRLAAQVLCALHGIDWKTVRKLRDTQNILKQELPSMVDLVKSSLLSGNYSKEKICELLKVDSEKLNEISLTPNTAHLTEFNLHDRALHCFTEAHRVAEFDEICQEAKSGRISDEQALGQLGDLMNGSHDSCSKLYQCSCAELDQLTEIARNCGALGSRLTGAGWGGCTVSLVQSGTENEFIDRIKSKYYAASSIGGVHSELIFATKPSGGAEVFDL